MMPAAGAAPGRAAAGDAAAPHDPGAETRMIGTPTAEPAGTVLDGSPYQPRLGIVRRDTAIFLEVLSGPQAGRVFDLGRAGTYVVGRRAGDIPLDDAKCSQKHARIEILAQAEYYVSDLASTNGTFLNEIRTTRRRLRHMDVLRIGSTLLRFSCMEGAIPVAATE